jgi:deaminated glutathione amidase
MKIGIAQITSVSDLEQNFKKMEALVDEGKSQGAELIVFPEMAYFSGKKADWEPIAQQFKPIRDRFCDLAKRYSVPLIPGTLREASSESDKIFNTLLFIDSYGQILSQYRKIFLYQASLPDRHYDETEYCLPGHQIATLQWKNLTLGFSICFDLRFPEIFRSLKKRGAQIVFLPSAFTVPTGQAHWETLIRARAIENQFFMVAAGLTGISGDGAAKYGHSLGVAPWGEILCDLKETEQIKILDVDLALIDEAEQKVPAWKCRREEIFPIA